MNYKEKLKDLYERTRDAQDNLPDKFLVDALYNKVVDRAESITPGFVSEYFYRLFVETLYNSVEKLPE